jgi:hypothetical protein
MSSALEGINEKLIRADENIRNLQSEVSRFFQECEYPVMPKLDDQRFSDALQYHKNLVIPPRFSVLVGEIIHHLRSCLDNVVWYLSCTENLTRRERKQIGFPILNKRSRLKNQVAAYKGKIKRVKSTRALKIILGHQPYKGAGESEALWVINELNIIDKHQGLVIISTGGRFETTSPALANEFREYMQSEGRQFTAEMRRKMDEHSSVRPQIAFGDFGRGKAQPVIPTLTDFLNYIRYLVGALKSELRD